MGSERQLSGTSVQFASYKCRYWAPSLILVVCPAVAETCRSHMLPPFSQLFPELKRRGTKLLASLIREYIDKLRHEAQRLGFGDGFEKGRASGYKKGFEEGQLIYRVEDLPAPAPKPVDPGLYGPFPFVVGPVEAAMRAEVAAAVKAKVVSPPTDEQWDMILADHPATCISAGAGSGKSTTLVLRVVFMLVHLQIPEEQLTVISFTKASCADLCRSLVKVMRHWGRNVDETWAERRVRTFHSVLWGLASVPFPGREFFDFYDGGKAADAPVDEFSVDNPIGGSKLNDAQSDVLREAYISLFNADDIFRGKILAILKGELAMSRSDRSAGDLEDYQLLNASERDRQVREFVESAWAQDGWPFDGIKTGDFKIPASIGNNSLYANGREVATGIPVVLDLHHSVDAKDRETKVGKRPVNIALAVNSKLKIISRYAETPYILLRSSEDVAAFQLRQKWLTISGAKDKLGDAPIFPLKIQGELSSLQIFEAMYAQGSFIESHGFEVAELIAKLPAPQVADVNANFIDALALFWPHLRRCMTDSGLHTFNQVFLAMARGAPSIAFSPAKIQSMRHLLIDEFQDISPQIAAWIKAMQRRILSDNVGLPVSIMAIGDDWQSIYGWRGSSPQLFIDFQKYFPAHAQLGPAPQLKFTANFRSIDQIIRDSERLISKVTSKVEKICRAQIATSEGDHGVKLIEYGKPKARTTDKEALDHLVKAVGAQYALALKMKSKHKDHLIVMTRSGEISKALRSAFTPKDYPGLAIGTYHKAKGLEADVAFMIDDCRAGSPHPLRNLIYRVSGMYPGYSYDDACADEALRLAYVGITRGRRRVVWHVRKADPDGSAVNYK